MELLGNSQTFLGTLATLSILCVFQDNSNFIFNILERAKELFQKEINSLRINTKFEKITESSDYKLLNRYLSDPNSNPEIRNEGIKLLSAISVAELELQLRYAPVENKGDILFERIHNSEEQILSPLYTFGYCIILFIFDELLRIPAIGHIDFLCSILTVFSLFSFVFWFMIWRKFHLKYMSGNKKSDIDTFDSPETDNLNSSKTYFRGFLCKLILSSVLLIAGMYICQSFFPTSIYPYILIFLLLIPITYIGTRKLFLKKQFTEYSHIFTIIHLIIFLTFALWLCLIVFLFIQAIGNNYNYLWLLPFNIHAFKLFVFIAILLNGLVLPFLMPYISYRFIYLNAQKSVIESQKESNIITEKLLRDLKEFCKNID